MTSLGLEWQCTGGGFVGGLTAGPFIRPRRSGRTFFEYAKSRDPNTVEAVNSEGTKVRLVGKHHREGRRQWAWYRPAKFGTVILCQTGVMEFCAAKPTEVRGFVHDESDSDSVACQDPPRPYFENYM